MYEVMELQHLLYKNLSHEGFVKVQNSANHNRSMFVVHAGPEDKETGMREVGVMR